MSWQQFLYSLHCKCKLKHCTNMAASQILVSSIRLSFNSKFPVNNISVWNRTLSTTCVMSKGGLQMKFQKEQPMSSNGILFQCHGSQLQHMGKTGHEISKGVFSSCKKFSTCTPLTYKTSYMMQFKASSTLQNYQQDLGHPWRYEHITSNEIYWRKVLFWSLAAFFTLSLYRRQARLHLEKSLKEDKEQKLKMKKEKALILSEESECSKQTFASEAEIPRQKIYEPCKRSPFCYLKLKDSLKNDETEECVEYETCDCIIEEDEFDDDYYALL